MKLTKEMKNSIVNDVIGKKHTETIKKSFEKLVSEIESEIKIQFAGDLEFLNHVGYHHAIYTNKIRRDKQFRFVDEKNNRIYMLVGFKKDQIPDFFEKEWKVINDNFYASFYVLDNGYNHLIVTDRIRNAAKTHTDNINSALEDDKIITAVVYSCSTDSQLIKTLPEISEFIPVKEITREIVAVETINAAKSILIK